MPVTRETLRRMLEELGGLEMTDEELTCSIREDIRGLIQQCPELAVTAAREIGWRVEPVS